MSPLAIGPGVLGWRVMRKRTGEALIREGAAAEYATGAATWAREKRRAFFFTTVAGQTHGSARGLNSGLRWAWAHARELRRREREDAAREGRAIEWRIVVIRVSKKGPKRA